MGNMIRLYTGTDGETHIEELDLTSHPELATLQAAKGIVFRTVQSGHFSDWHNAPRRQFVITLAGEVEIGLGDGSVHRFGAGHVTLAEDLTGKGHTTRAVGNQPRLTATIPLADA
jgi:quercetin dioxygenase-like cupin family protein